VFLIFDDHPGKRIVLKVLQALHTLWEEEKKKFRYPEFSVLAWVSKAHIGDIALS
jgi:Iap family predicted aminopeptidase